MSDSRNFERSFCWNGNDDHLRKLIRRNEYVKRVRSKLMEKKKYRKGTKKPIKKKNN